VQIKIDFGTLKETKWYEFAIRFALGGVITVIAGLIAKKFGPAIGGLFLAFPAIFPASATLVEDHEEKKKQEKGMHGAERGRDAAALDAAGAAMGSVGLMLFALVVWQLLEEHSAWLTLLLALVIWFVSSCAVWFVREHRHRIFGVRRHAHSLSFPTK
jgi:hypothetical protein